MIRNVYAFRVDGPLLGYRASAKRAFDPRYRAFKNLVRYLANSAGVPDELLDTDSAEIYVRLYWKKGARLDGSNAFKALEDSVFKQDRRVIAGHFLSHFNCEKEYADVSITVERR